MHDAEGHSASCICMLALCTPQRVLVDAHAMGARCLCHRQTGWCSDATEEPHTLTLGAVGRYSTWDFASSGGHAALTSYDTYPG